MSEDRLQRIEQILQATAILTQQNREDLVTLTQATKNNTGSIKRLEERLDQFITQAEADRELIRSEFTLIRGEMTGLRTEVVRILEHLFGRQNEN